MTLLDTNILIRMTDIADPRHSRVVAAVDDFVNAGRVLSIVPQNLYEFWTTATRPLSASGLGLSVPDCILEIAEFKRVFLFLPDLPSLYAEWERLVTTHACHGRVSFDARLVAAMKTHGIDTLLTLNAPDFRRYPGLTIIDPLTVSVTP